MVVGQVVVIINNLKYKVMPKSYEKIRDACLAKGKSAKFCKTKAAKIYNGVLRKRNPSLPKLSNKKGAK